MNDQIDHGPRITYAQNGRVLRVTERVKVGEAAALAFATFFGGLVLGFLLAWMGR